MSEIEKALAELQALMKYRAKELGAEEDFRGLGLTSRKNLCLHPSVKREKSGNVVDARCRSLTAGFVREKKNRGEDVEQCEYHDVSDWRFGGGARPMVCAKRAMLTAYCLIFFLEPLLVGTAQLDTKRCLDI